MDLPIKKPPFLVVGNGPSVNRLRILEKETRKWHIGVCNMFAYYSPSFLGFPRFYYLADPAYWNINDYDGQESLFGLIGERFPFATLVLPRNAQPIVQKHIQYNNMRLYDPRPEISVYHNGFYEHFSASSNYMPGVQTVTHLMLYHAIALGYKQIYLVGIEMDDWKNVKGNLDGIQASCYSHYYDDQKPDTSHGRIFRPKNPGTHLAEYDYLRLMEDGLRAVKGFYNLALLARSLNIEVINLSVESWLDCFPKIDPSSL